MRDTLTRLNNVTPDNYAQLPDSPQLRAVESQWASHFDQYVTVLDFAERNLGRLTMQRDKLMFHRQPDLDAYRELMRRVNADSRTESAAQEKLLAAQRSGAQGMGTLVDKVSR